MEKNIYTQPDFLFCELPIKDNSFNDNRNWIYSRLSNSLIEAVSVNEFKDFRFNGIQERYEYENSDGIMEDYFLVFVQNNCHLYPNYNPKEILDAAWKFYKDYLIWEDGNVDDL